MFFVRKLFPLFLLFLLSLSVEFGFCEYIRQPVAFSKLATCQEFDIHSNGCKHFFPIESIKNYKSKEYKLHLKFYVMAEKDANVVLTNGFPKGKVVYTAVVGGDVNRHSWLRNTNGTTVGLDSHLTDILSPLWATPIEVKQKTTGQLGISIPGVADPLLLADASDLDEVKAFCIYAWKNKSRWFYNCAEIEDIFLDTASLT